MVAEDAVLGLSKLMNVFLDAVLHSISNFQSKKRLGHTFFQHLGEAREPWIEHRVAHFANGSHNFQKQLCHVTQMLSSECTTQQAGQPASHSFAFVFSSISPSKVDLISLQPAFTPPSSLLSHPSCTVSIETQPEPSLPVSIHSHLLDITFDYHDKVGTSFQHALNKKLNQL